MQESKYYVKNIRSRIQLGNIEKKRVKAERGNAVRSIACTYTRYNESRGNGRILFARLEEYR